jgi:hypothetical protein
MAVTIGGLFRLLDQSQALVIASGLECTTTLYWRGRGTIEYTEARRFWTFIMTGAIDTFTTKDETRDGFLRQAEKWVDDRLIS